MGREMLSMLDTFSSPVGTSEYRIRTVSKELHCSLFYKIISVIV